MLTYTRRHLPLALFVILFSISIASVTNTELALGQSDPAKVFEELMQRNIEKYAELGEKGFKQDCMDGGVPESICAKVTDITREEVEASRRNQSSSSTPEDIIYETYTNYDLGYSVEYPSDWQVLHGDIVKGTREFTAQLDNDSRLALLDTKDFAQIILEVYQEDKNFKVTDNFGEINIDDESAHTFSYSENNKETMVVALVHENVPYLFKYQTLKENFDKDADIMMRFFSSVKFLDSAAIGNRQEITSESKVSISPSCGPTNGFTITVSVYGFKPHTTVNWKLVNSNELIPMYGYFSTNNEGQLSDIIKLDDLKEDSYKIYFGEDVDNDGQTDSPSDMIYAELNIPCAES